MALLARRLSMSVSVCVMLLSAQPLMCDHGRIEGLLMRQEASQRGETTAFVMLSSGTAVTVSTTLMLNCGPYSLKRF